MAQPKLNDYTVHITIEYDLTFSVEATDKENAKDIAEDQALEQDLGSCSANIHCYEVIEEFA